MSTRTVHNIIEGRPASDGAGVKLIRSLGRSPQLRVDPFLMLDAFSTDSAADYIGGFPAHPHRGFETVTYMLEGRMQHEDHMGNRGELNPGDVQWMTAGRGIIHSEMPLQQEGRMRGFQLWLNLPASEKMKPAAYRDIPASRIPEVTLSSGAQVKLIAGQLELEDQSIHGPINSPAKPMSTDPLYVDIALPAGSELSLPLTPDYNAFIYPYKGSIQVADTDVTAHQVGTLSPGADVQLMAQQDSQLLLFAGRPLNEPVAQYGPFVMNTMEEVEQAIRDYRDGRLTEAA